MIDFALVSIGVIQELFLLRIAELAIVAMNRVKDLSKVLNFGYFLSRSFFDRRRSGIAAYN